MMGSAVQGCVSVDAQPVLVSSSGVYCFLHQLDRNACSGEKAFGASGGIWTRDHRLTRGSVTLQLLSKLKHALHLLPNH